jgi:RNA polymerase sigma-70 factor (ECF subfamily)
MHTTSSSLLLRLRQPGDRDAWERFCKLYTPLLFHWARRFGLQDDDAADLVQDILTTLIQKLPGFCYEPSKRFRGWLWTVSLNRFRMAQRRAQVPTAQGAAALDGCPAVSNIEEFDEAEYRRHVVGRALQLMQSEFEESTWQACWQHVVAGRRAAEVAAELGLSVGAVYVAKSRVLRRLREELGEMLD